MIFLVIFLCTSISVKFSNFLKEKKVIGGWKHYMVLLHYLMRQTSADCRPVRGRRPLKHVVYSRRPLEAIVAATFRGRLALTYVLMLKAAQCVRRLCLLFRHGYLVKRPLFSIVSIFKCSEGCVKNAIFTFADVLDF